MQYPLFQRLDKLASDRWLRQGLRTLLRALWLAVCVWCIGLGGQLVFGWTPRYELLGIVSLVVVVGGALLLLRPKMSRREVAQRLDRRFHLDEQLATAIEVAGARPARDSIEMRLLAESEQTIARVQRRIVRQQHTPWSDIIALLALLVVLAGLVVTMGIGRASDLDNGLAPLPSLAGDQPQQPSAEPFQTPEPQQGTAPGTQPSQKPGADPSLTGPVADALREQGATRPAAEALDRGDTAAAAQQLRELADQADQLSQQSRNDLAERLRDAAGKVQDKNQQLGNQLQQSANDLQRGGQDASKALEDLARSVEQLGQPGDQQSQQGQQGQGDQQGQQGQGDQQAQGDQQGQGQQGQGEGTGGTGNGSSEQRQSTQNSRLGVDGQPMQLDAEGDGKDAPGDPQKPPTSARRVPGTTSGGGNSDSNNGTTGADPLRVPVDERDVVQDYFQP